MAQDTAEVVQKVKLESVRIEMPLDECGWGGEGLEYLGRYDDRWAPGCIDRAQGGTWTGREYRYWHWAQDAAEEVARWKARGWSKQAAAEEVARWKAADYARCEAYNEGRWYYMGVLAKAQVRIWRPGGWDLQWIQSAGLWGIESDAGREYLEEAAREELADLRADLEALGVVVAEATWTGLAENAVNAMGEV